MATKRKSNPARYDRRGNEIIKIAYGAVPHHAGKGGFAPVIWVNGRDSSAWSHKSYDLEDACKIAKRMAVDQSEHYGGDWNISIVGCARGSKDLLNRLHKDVRTLHKDLKPYAWQKVQRDELEQILPRRYQIKKAKK